MNTKIKQEKRIRRHKRVRAKIFGTSRVPRFCVFRSNKHIYGQLIDDEKGRTILSGSDLELKRLEAQSSPKTASPTEQARLKAKEEKPKLKETLKGKVLVAYKVGKLIGQKAKKKKIKKVVFDRGGYKYHGRVRALAQGARDGGLKF